MAFQKVKIPDFDDSITVILRIWSFKKKKVLIYRNNLM